MSMPAGAEDTYRFLRQLGSRMDSTHAAIRADHDLLVVQRFMRSVLDTERVHLETQCFLKNWHPNVARVRYIEASRDELLVATEFVDGATLDELLAIELAPPVVVRIIVDVLAGLQNMHGMRDASTALIGAFHGAVCPVNVVVGKDGVARLVAPFRTRPIGLDERAESLCYAAPEAVEQQGVTQSSSDLYACGVMLWEALQGRRLFAEEQPSQILQRQREEEVAWIAPPGSLAERVGPVVLKMLAFEPALRFRSAGECASALRQAAAAEIAAGSRVAQTVVEVAGDRIRARRAELDQRPGVSARPGGLATASARPPVVTNERTPAPTAVAVIATPVPITVKAVQAPVAPVAAKTPPAPVAAKTPPAPVAAKTPPAPVAAKTPPAPAPAKTPPAPVAAKTPPAPAPAKTPPAPAPAKTPPAPAPVAAKTPPAPVAATTVVGPRAITPATPPMTLPAAKALPAAKEPLAVPPAPPVQVIAAETPSVQVIAAVAPAKPGAPPRKPPVPVAPPIPAPLNDVDAATSNATAPAVDPTASPAETPAAETGATPTVARVDLLSQGAVPSLEHRVSSTPAAVAVTSSVPPQTAPRTRRAMPLRRAVAIVAFSVVATLLVIAVVALRRGVPVDGEHLASNGRPTMTTTSTAALASAPLASAALPRALPAPEVPAGGPPAIPDPTTTATNPVEPSAPTAPTETSVAVPEPTTPRVAPRKTPYEPLGI